MQLNECDEKMCRQFNRPIIDYSIWRALMKSPKYFENTIELIDKHPSRRRKVKEMNSNAASLPCNRLRTELSPKLFKGNVKPYSQS